jgi:NADH-quinone oxidoreductase subunit D
MFTFNEDRSLFPEQDEKGKPIVDVESGQFTKIWQGPIHPGMTGNMSLELTIQGDEIMDCVTHVGYLHRGFEKLMERRRFIQCFPICVRVAVPEPDFNEYCLASTIEELGGIEVPEAANWMRTLLLEMSRLQSYLAQMGGQGSSFGLGLIGQWTIWARDLVLDRFEEISGGRIYHMHMPPGGVRSLLPAGFVGRMNETLDEISAVMEEVERVLFHNSVFRKRAIGLGYIDPNWVDEYGITGPNARAAGVPKDVRKDNPYLMYDKLDFDVHVEYESDVFARTKVRYKDILTTIDLIRQILPRVPVKGEFMADVPNVLHWKIPYGETYKRAECTRGEYGYYTVTDGSGYPRRINVRGPSYTHAVTLMEKMAINLNIADTAGVMSSLHTYPPEVER